MIRAATRSAYAEVCELPELGRANFETMMKSEEAKTWTVEQLLMINALHMFSVSYFTGNIKITEGRADGRPPERGWESGGQGGRRKRPGGGPGDHDPDHHLRGARNARRSRSRR